jgi:hypothetical protein
MYWTIVLINLPEIRGCNRQRDSLTQLSGDKENGYEGYVLF